MAMYLDKSLKKKPGVLQTNPGKNPQKIQSLNIYAFISTDTSFEDLLTTIRMIRLTEQERSVYALLLKKFKHKKISEELKISLTNVKTILESIQIKLKLKI